MKSKNENLDDVVFEERNKNYGAFLLRKNYNKNVVIALSLALLFFFSAIASLLADKYGGYIGNGPIVVFDPIPPPPEPKPIDPLPEPIKKEKLPVYVAPTVVAEPVDDPVDLFDLMEKVTTEQITDFDGTIKIEDIQVNPLINDNTEEPPAQIVQMMPSFIGGEDAMYKWLGKNIKYPQIAKETGIEGTVILTFVVEKDGAITSIKILRDIGGGCGEEAVRVVNLMPKWREGRQNNISVRVQFNLPVKFTLI